MNTMTSFSNENDITVSDELGMSLMCMELFAESESHFPSPKSSRIIAIFLQICPKTETRAFLVGDRGINTPERVDVEVCEDELSLIDKFVLEVQKWDPDILVSYDCNTSWKFFTQRALILGYSNIFCLLSRVPLAYDSFTTLVGRNIKERYKQSKQVFSWLKDASSLSISGRVIISMWKEIRKKTALRTFSFEEGIFRPGVPDQAVFQFFFFRFWSLF